MRERSRAVHRSFDRRPAGFIDRVPYPQRIEQEQKRTGLREAAVVGTGMIRARRVAFGVTDSGFIMGSMGSVVARNSHASSKSPSISSFR